MPPLHFGTLLDQKLIKLVRENPLLYNPEHPGYSSSDAKELTWQKISDALGRPTAEFGGIQCHIQFGDYNEEKHKPGFIENLSEYLPEQYSTSWGIEKKILKEYSSHAGLNELEAKHLYTKTARALPTYGVTFFLVKEKQKGKKKLVPRLLGINADAILRLDETSKEIIQTWPLTHVKTYHAGKGETFTLNFGDYTDKEYSVKTRDAFRIRDILEGYIDLIRKRMLAHYNISATDHGYVGQDNITVGQANMVQHISNNPSKVFAQSFVGPSKIVEYEPGQVASQGTQMVTAHQMLVNEIKNKQDQGVLKAEVGMRQDMGVPFTRRLNRLNSNSVQIVTLLTEPTETHIGDTRKIVDGMNADMPSIRDGVKGTIAKQTSEEDKKKLQDQLNELDELMRVLSQSTDPAAVNASEAEDAAKRIASLSTEMYFAIAPETRRRSRILSKSRNSFIADEKAEFLHRRPSFIAASATAIHALDSAAELAQEDYKGSALTPQQVDELERAAVDKLGKINAAIAHYMLAHSDPQNIDYSAAVTSLNTIHELMPDLARDAQALASVKDGKDRTALINDIKELCAAAKHVCSLSGVEDTDKLQDALSKYSDVSGRLVYVFGKRGAKPRADKENQILELADAVVDKTSALLKSTQDLTSLANTEPAADDVNEAGAKTATAAKNLHAQAVLNSPTIHEPHCRSALTAASEALSSRAQQLVACWKPLVEPPPRHVLGEKLHNQTMDLAKALDRLNAAYTDVGTQEVKATEKPRDEAQRLKFIHSMSKIGDWKAAEDDLNKLLTSAVSDSAAEEAQKRLSDRIAQLNATLAALLAATSDRENPDYATAESAIATINELMPDLIKDSKTASANYDEASKAALLDDIKALCAATKNVCASAHGGEPEALNEALIGFTNSSGKLTYVFNRRTSPDREAKIIDATSSSCAQAGVLLSGVQQLAEAEGGAVGEQLDARGAALADAAQTLLTTAQVTATSISDPRCQSTLSSSIDKVSSAGKALEDSYAPLKANPKHETRVLALQAARRQLEKQLDRLRAACQLPDNDVQSTQDLLTSERQGEQPEVGWKKESQSAKDRAMEQEKLKFIATMRGAKEKLADAQKELNKPSMSAKGSDMSAVQQRLTQGLEQLNATVAALLAATADRENPDCATAGHAADTISKLMPQLIKDTKTVSAAMDEPVRAAMLSEIKALCDASQGICASAYGDDSTQQNVNDAVAKFTDASGKLVFVVNPRKSLQKKDEIVKLASAACADTSALLGDVQRLAEGVGGARGREIDQQGGRLATAAQNMLQSAQILSPSLPSKQCQEALLTSVDSVSAASSQLAARVSPLQSDVTRGAAAQQALQQLDNKLDTLKAAVEATDVGSQDPSQEQQKLQFIKAVEATKEKWAEAQRELKKPVPPARGADAAALAARLRARLAALDAAVAALLAATADRDKPQYAEAEKQVKTIAELLPQIVQDSKSVSASKEEPARAAMLSEIQALCDASQGICASACGEDPQGLNDAVAKFSDASGKLVFVVNPRKNVQKQNEIVNLASAACGETSALLMGVQQLAEGVGGAQGQELDAQGGRLADQAQNLLQTVQITAPSLSSPECRTALLVSADSMSAASSQLATLLSPLQSDATRGAVARDTLQALQRLDNKLGTLKKAVEAAGSQDVAQEQERLQFIKRVEAIKEKVADAHKELKKPVPPARGADAAALAARLRARLAALDAAVAALLAATADRDKLQYAEAEKSMKTISELLPHVIQDTKSVSASKDEPARAAMLSEIQALCDASQGICASAYGDDTQGLNDAVSKFADASGKLVFVVNPRKNLQKQNEVVNLASAACGETSLLLAGVQQLAEAVGGAQGQELDAQGGLLADQAQNLLQTVQITAPSLSSAECRAALLGSADSMSAASSQLAARVSPLQSDVACGAAAQQSLQALQRLDDKLDKLKAAVEGVDVSSQEPCREQQKLQFIKTVEATKEKWADAQKELKKPVPPARGADAGALGRRLRARLAALDAAVAALLAATADRDKPQYAEAEKHVKTISEMLPHIIQDTKSVSASKDEPARAAMLSEIQALCDASQGICASAYREDPQGLNTAVAKFSDASGKLIFVASPRANTQKDKEVVEQAQAACSTTASLLPALQLLAEGAGGAQGRELDALGASLADQAQNLLQTAQITAPSLSSPECRAALLSSVENTSQSAEQLSRSLSAVSADSKQDAAAKKLLEALQQLQNQLDRLRKTCNEPDTDTAAAPSKQPPPLPSSKPPPQVAHAAPNRRSNVDVTQDFLERMRCEEGMARQTAPAVVGGVDKVKPPPPVRKTDDEKHRPEFVKSLEDAEQTIRKHEAGLMKQCRSPGGAGPALPQRDMLRRQAQLQRRLAQAGVEVANLVAANYADKIDYAAATKSTKALPQLMTSIVEDGTQLSDNLNDLARKAFLYDMLQMCEAARKTCDAAGTDRQKLNDAAIHFGDTSTKLLYVVSSDVDPALEKEIITRAKAIGDSASRLALDAANVATAASGTAASVTDGSGTAVNPVQEICDAGTACVDAAGKLVYTAKLTAPSIHEKTCQDALVASTETLSTKLKSFAGSWELLESDPQQAKTIGHLSAEASNLEKILDGLRSDVREGSIGRRRELEQLVIEDTPIRQLTVKILDEAKAHAEAPLPAPQQIAYAAYADNLTEALRALDLANARCKKTPHDTDKRRDLEAAIQNLQMILLQSRPSRGDKGKTNIVDLMDFMEEVSAEAKSLSSAASSTKVPTPQDKMTLEEMTEKCDKIEAKANQLISGEVSSDLDFNDLFDQFGQECEDVIKQISKDVKGMEDIKAKKLLQPKVMAFSESCNMLRFATKSGISTEACATLDASLDELDDIEDRVIKSIVKDAAAPGVTLRTQNPPRSGHSPATIALCREVASSPAGVAPATVAAYVADAAARTDTNNPEENKKLLKHLYKLVHLLKTLAVTSSKRAATWQPVDGPDTARITEQILQEIYNPESKFGATSGDKQQKILDDDITKLLIPSAPRILGDQKQQEHKLTELASELITACGAVWGEAEPGALRAAARRAVAAARGLDEIARGGNAADPVQRRKIDEAAKEMSFCTYNVLKTAESACLDPKNTALKRRLSNALQNLNHSVDKLVWLASSAPALQRQCGALARGAAAQLAALQPRALSAAPFGDACDLIAEQEENISKLKSDQPMPRKVFMRNLDDIGTAVRTSVEGATQCAYYIAVSDQHKDIAKLGVVDVPKIQLALESIQDSCMSIISCNQYDQAKEKKEDLHKRVLDFSNALDKAQMQVKNSDAKRTLVRAKSCVSEAADGLEKGLERQNSLDKVAPEAVHLLEAVNRAHGMIEQCPLVPAVESMGRETKEKCDEVMNNSKNLLSNTLALLKNVNEAPEEPEMMTWVTFNTNRQKLLDAYDALVKSVRRNGHRAGIYEKAPEEEEEKPEPRKSYIETQVDLANKWLKSPTCKTEVKVIGQQAARNVVDMARQLSEDLKGPEREEVRNVISETEELLSECGKKYDHEKNSILMDRLKELRKCIQRGVVTRVVEDFIEAEAPLADLDLLADIEQDEFKRKFILERKIASLLAQLGRVTKTARFVINAGQQQSIGVELTQCSEETELLAPKLVQAAQQRIDHPDDKTVIENYKVLLGQYADSISKVRDLCDRAVDPVEFVQTAGDTMQRMREDMSQSSSDPQKCAFSSNAITRLGHRVIAVSMSSAAGACDPELRRALLAAQARLAAATPAPHARASRRPHWRDTTAEILSTTGDVESALCGENIFKKKPTTANQPIYSVARDLHESVREWSSRDNEIVGVARRMAVLMARLSEHMETDNKNALIATSKSIVAESQEVAELAKKLAHECSDVRIKTNLLQTCERIPTISGQLKMLTTVKANSLGQQGVEADKEAMDMLVGNAQSLMLSIQEVVKAAAGASVKIMSQRGPRLRWVRKNYY